MSQPAKQKRIRVWALGYDATIKAATEQEPEAVLHATGNLNVERDDLEDAVKAAKKIVLRLYPDREVLGVAITSSGVIADVVVEV